MKQTYHFGDVNSSRETVALCNSETETFSSRSHFVIRTYKKKYTCVTVQCKENVFLDISHMQLYIYKLKKKKNVV